MKVAERSKGKYVWVLLGALTSFWINVRRGGRKALEQYFSRRTVSQSTLLTTGVGYTAFWIFKDLFVTVIFDKVLPSLIVVRINRMWSYLGTHVTVRTKQSGRSWGTLQQSPSSENGIVHVQVHHLHHRHHTSSRLLFYSLPPSASDNVHAAFWSVLAWTENNCLIQYFANINWPLHGTPDNGRKTIQREASLSNYCTVL